MGCVSTPARWITPLHPSTAVQAYHLRELAAQCVEVKRRDHVLRVRSPLLGVAVCSSCRSAGPLTSACAFLCRYLFKYIIIGDTGACRGPALRSVPALVCARSC